MAPDDITPGAASGADDNDAFEYVEEVVEYRDTRGIRTLLIILLIILLLLLAGVGYTLWKNAALTGGVNKAGKSTGSEMVWVSSIYGWGDAADQQLVAPNAVSVGPDGTIWSNSNNHLAVAFTPQGKLVRILRSNSTSSTATTGSAMPGASHPGTGTGAAASGVQAVFGIDVDNNNNLFIADDASGHVLKFTPEGKLVKGWSVPGLGKISANDSLVAVTGRGNIGVFNQSTGVPVFGFGTRGQGINQFDLPAGVHIDDQGFVYVADTQNQRVRKYTPSGRLVWDAGTVPNRQFQAHVAAPTGLFQLPTAVTTDANGRVIVLDAFNYNITVLNGSTGKKIASYGTYGQDDGQFDSGSAIAYDRVRDYFVVADTGNNRLQIVRIPGSAAGISAGSLLSQALSNPAWILCLPFIVLLLAILATAAMNRRRKQREAAAALAAAKE